jgi:hypothetical protein
MKDWHAAQVIPVIESVICPGLSDSLEEVVAASPLMLFVLNTRILPVLLVEMRVEANTVYDGKDALPCDSCWIKGHLC